MNYFNLLLFFIILANWADFRSSVFLNIDLLKALFLQLPTAIRVIQSLKEQDNVGKNELSELNSQASPSDVNVLDQLSEINLGDEHDTPKAKVIKTVKGKRKRSVLQEEETEDDDDEEEVVKRPVKLKKTVVKKAGAKATRSTLVVEEGDENDDDDDEEIVKKSSKTKKAAPKKKTTVKSTRKKKVVETEEGK